MNIKDARDLTALLKAELAPLLARLEAIHADQTKARIFDQIIEAAASMARHTDAPEPMAEAIMDWIDRAKAAEAECERLTRENAQLRRALVENEEG